MMPDTGYSSAILGPWIPTCGTNGLSSSGDGSGCCMRSAESLSMSPASRFRGIGRDIAGSGPRRGGAAGVAYRIRGLTRSPAGETDSEP